MIATHIFCEFIRTENYFGAGHFTGQLGVMNVWFQDIESNNEAMICTGDNPAHNQTMYKDVYKYIFYQGCLNGLMIITGHKPAH